MSVQVTIVGDGNMTPAVVAGDRLSNYDELVSTGTRIPVPMNIKQTRRALGKLVFE